MELLVILSVLVSSLIQVAKFAAVPLSNVHLELTSSPDVLETVKTHPIPSPHPYLQVLNPGAIMLMRPKTTPQPQVVDNLRSLATNMSAEPQEHGSVSTPDHVQVGMSPLPTLLPRPDHLQPSESDPSNFSARLVGGERHRLGMIVGVNEKKSVGLPAISKLSDVVRGIYWMFPGAPSSPLTTDANNKRITLDAEKWIFEVKTQRRVTHMESNERHCGRNYLVTFDDGSQACVKQRRNYDQIQGEIFAYFLGDLLQMRHHLPPTVLTKAVHSRLFELVMDKIHHSPTWDPVKPFIITKFISNLKPLFLPKLLHPLLQAMVSGAPPPESLPIISPRSEQLEQLSKDELRQVGQWSDLVIFDYLLANLDRVANSAVNLQWHQQMLSLPVHNVFQMGDEGNFIFMDNESGLFHGYRLLDQYDKYLLPLLRSFCIFNKSTVGAIRKLHQSHNAATQLMKMMQMDYPRLLNRLPGIGPKTGQILQKRIRVVFNHIRFCEENYYLP